MQKVSQDWKNNQNKTLVSESDIEVSLKLTDPDAYEDATAEANDSAYYSNTENVVSDGAKIIHPYATLERNLWLLDGSREIVPDSNYGNAGFVSAIMCNNSNTFGSRLIVSVNFSQVHSKLIQGVTIRWSEYLNEYAVEFIVTAYNGNTVVATKTVTDNNSVLSTIPMDIANYNKITIEIVKWSIAYRRARIEDIFIGVNHIFSKKSLFSYDCSMSVDPISAELPKSEVSFSIDNLDNTFNPYNTDGLSKYLMERQEIEVKYGYKLDSGYEWMKGGKFYISEWDAQQSGMSAEFKARDLLGFMTGAYYKGLYNPSGTSLYDLAEDVLQDSGLPLNSDGSVKWVIDEKLKNIYTIAPLPIDTHANCLQMIANAGECVICQDRDGLLHIKSMSYDETDYSINHFNSYSKPDLSLSKPLKEVAVPCYGYSVSTDVSEIYKGNVAINGTLDVVITYSGTATNVSAVVTGGTLNSARYYSNACVLNITSAGSVDIVVSGNSLTSSSVAVIVTSGVQGETISVDNPLLTSNSRALSVGSWVENYMKNRMVLSSDWRADPRLDALDIVDNENDYGVDKVIMTSVEYSYNGAFKGSGEGRVI